MTTYKHLVWGLTLACGMGMAHAQQEVRSNAAGDARLAAATPEGGVLQEVVVTGTHQQNVTAIKSMSSITVLPAAALEKTGKLGLEEILADALPSVNLPSNAGGDLTSIVREIDMRGLPGDDVLVLVNGKRFHPSAIVNVSGSVNVGAQPVDLSMIPPSAIQRIEVLNDGAAALYGSDAIAGVVNIILNSDPEGGSADVQSGQYFKGDGPATEADARAGFNWGAGGFIDLFGTILRQNITNRAVDATYSPAYYPGDIRNNIPLGIVYKGYGVPDVRSDQIGFNALRPINDDISFYAFATSTYSQGENWIGWRSANNNNNVTGIFPDGFEPREVVNQVDFNLTAGVKGSQLFGWNWDLSSTYGSNNDPIDLQDSVNPTYGLQSPTFFHEGDLTATELTNNLDFKRQYDTGIFAAPLTAAFGFEDRVDTFGIGAGQPQSYGNGGQPQLTGPNAELFVDVPGAQGLAGFRPADAGTHSRSNLAAYADLETTVLPKWDMGLAGRLEHYSDFGSNASGRFSTRYQVVPALAVRATVSNGFRAPSVGQEYYSASTTSQYKGVDYNIVTLAASSQAARLLGSAPLKPEISNNYSVGFVFTPLQNLAIVADAYQINIRDRIVLSANIGLTPSGALDPGVGDVLTASGIEGVNAARYFINGANTKTDGIDVNATYSSDLAEYGRVGWSAGFDKYKTEFTSINAIASQTLYGTQVFNQVARDEITDPIPSYKLILSANYTVSRWTVFVRETGYGSWVTPSTVTNGYSYEGAKWLTDLEIGYSPSTQLHFAVGAQNLFNVYPDKTNPLNFSAATFNGAQIYNSASPFGISGGNWYARVTYVW